MKINPKFETENKVFNEMQKDTVHVALSCDKWKVSGISAEMLENAT